MNLSAPLTALARRTDAVALQVLAIAGEQLTGRQVARLAGESTPSNIRHALLRLVDTGLVTATVRPDAVMYTVNRQHLIWPAVESMLGVRKSLLEKLKSLANRHASFGTTVILYGSVARGESDSDSDVDLLVIQANSAVTREAFLDYLRADVHKWTGNRAQIFDATPEEVRRMWKNKDPLVDAWLREGLLITGLSLEDQLGGDA